MADLGKEYTDTMSAEQLLKYISNDPIELSHDKAVNQRDWYKRICSRWLEYNKKD